MKVMCIDDTLLGKKLMLEVGVIYNASQCNVYPNNYDIAEIPFLKDGRRVSYRKHLFVPLSDIDETEFIREYNKEKV